MGRGDPPLPWHLPRPLRPPTPCVSGWRVLGGPHPRARPPPYIFWQICSYFCRALPALPARVCTLEFGVRRAAF